MKRKDAFAAGGPEDIRRRKVISIVLVVVIAVVFGLLTYYVGRPLVREFRESPETFRDYVSSHGALGHFVMIGIMMMQVVVALVPGEPFELGAGFAFGWLEGSVLCLIGSALASALIYGCTRKWGVKLVELFFPRERILKFSFLQREKQLNLLIFILYLIPGTPKDLITYLVGLTPMRLWPFLALSTAARIPSVVSSAVTGSLAQRGNLTAALITYGVTIVISIGCILWYRQMSRKNQTENKGINGNKGSKGR